MTLLASGAMSLGGSTAQRSVNLELNRAATASINMNETAVRNLAGQASGAICMTNFYNKAAAGKFGSSAGGGFYIGTICAAGSCYCLILSPNATGCVACCWKTTNTCSFVGDERCNGHRNTYVCTANATHPGPNFTATRSIGGFSDWYLPAYCELNQMFDNRLCVPSGQGYSGPRYWTSTEGANNSQNATVARMQFGAGFGNSRYSVGKIACQCIIRAVRRVAF